MLDKIALNHSIHCPLKRIHLGEWAYGRDHHPTADADLLDLLRCDGPLGVVELAEAVNVTPTAIRQRLVRLLAQNLIEREVERCGRGRPRHRYRLTTKGCD